MVKPDITQSVVLDGEQVIHAPKCLDYQLVSKLVDIDKKAQQRNVLY